MFREKSIRFKGINSKFFHAIAIGRRRRKIILSLLVGEKIIKGPRAIKNEVRRFFKRVYSQLDVPKISLPVDLLPRIGNDEARMLERRSTPEEVKVAVWECGSSKSPRYDGYNFNFIKNTWDLLSSDVVCFVVHFFESGCFSEEINMT